MSRSVPNSNSFKGLSPDEKEKLINQHLDKHKNAPLNDIEKTKLRDKMRAWAKQQCSEDFIEYNKCILNNSITGAIRCKAKYLIATDCMNSL